MEDHKNDFRKYVKIIYYNERGMKIWNQFLVFKNTCSKFLDYFITKPNSKSYKKLNDLIFSLSWEIDSLCKQENNQEFIKRANIALCNEIFSEKFSWLFYKTSSDKLNAKEETEKDRTEMIFQLNKLNSLISKETENIKLTQNFISS